MSNEAKNIAAFTANSSPYPPYISINRTPVGNVTITVRSDPDGVHEGCLAGIMLWPEEWADLCRQIDRD